MFSVSFSGGNYNTTIDYSSSENLRVDAFGTVTALKEGRGQITVKLLQNGNADSLRIYPDRHLLYFVL